MSSSSLTRNNDQLCTNGNERQTNNNGSNMEPEKVLPRLKILNQITLREGAAGDLSPVQQQQSQYLPFDEDLESDQNSMQNDIYINDNDIEELQNKLNLMCRFCLAEDEDLQPIFDEYSCISDMFFVLVSVQLQQNDGLPENICYECLTQLKRSFNFKQQVETAESVLRYFIEEGFKTGMTLEKIEADNLEKYAQIHSTQFGLEFMNNIDREINDNDEEYSEQDCGNENDDYYEDYDIDTSQTFPSIPAKLDETNTELIDNDNLVESSLPNEKLLTDQPNYNCHECDKCFKNQTCLNQHIKKKHEDSNSKKNFKRTPKKTMKKNQNDKKIEKNVVKGVKQLSNTKPKETIKQEKDLKIVQNYECDKCEQTFAIKDDLFIHNAIHLKAGEDGKFSCHKCDKKCQDVVKLKRHVRIHFIDKPYKCRTCGLGFPEMCSLTRHVRKKHSDQKIEKKFSCEFCDKKYFDGYSLMLHIRTHTKEQPHACTQCDKKFTDVRLLNSHRKTHLGIKSHACQYCDKKFTHYSTLVTHIRTHTGEKPYVCLLCHKYFIQSSNLRLHMRVHSGEKPYNCDLCNKTFSSSSALRVHKFNHHTNKKGQHLCPHCKRTFRNNDNYSKHLLTHVGKCDDCPKTFSNDDTSEMIDLAQNKSKEFIETMMENIAEDSKSCEGEG